MVAELSMHAFSLTPATGIFLSAVPQALPDNQRRRLTADSLRHGRMHAAFVDVASGDDIARHEPSRRHAATRAAAHNFTPALHALPCLRRHKRPQAGGREQRRAMRRRPHSLRPGR